MNSTGIVAVSLIFGTGFVAVLGGVVVKIIKVAKGMDDGESANGERRPLDEEARTVDELADGLAGMAKRIEVLETILLDRERRGDGR